MFLHPLLTVQSYGGRIVTAPLSEPLNSSNKIYIIWESCRSRSDHFKALMDQLACKV